jgi:hypothetical protein
LAEWPKGRGLQRQNVKSLELIVDGWELRAEVRRQKSGYPIKQVVPVIKAEANVMVVITVYTFYL